MLTLAIAPWVVSLLVAIFLFACVVLILTVLIQRPQGGGLSGAFGAGGGAGQTAFGTKTGDALTIATVGLFVVFLGLAIGLNFVTRPSAITPIETSATSAEDESDGTATSVGDEPAEGGAADSEAATDEPSESDAADLMVPPADEAPAETPADNPAETPADDGASDDGTGTDTPAPGDG